MEPVLVFYQEHNLNLEFGEITDVPVQKPFTELQSKPWAKTPADKKIKKKENFRFNFFILPEWLISFYQRYIFNYIISRNL
ncbi:MAG: hypothetical protein K0S44_368 [Bacteroidetes bacterium]|jgi:hypothetical protein|nr:hypothetical protein [Bacteroidota bacterium]